MRLRCLSCGKSCSSEVPDETVLRALLTCPECYAVECDRMQAEFGERIDRLRLGVGSEPQRDPGSTSTPDA